MAPDNLFAIDSCRHPTLQRIKDDLLSHHRFAAGIIDRSARLFGASWASAFEALASAVFQDPEAIAAAARGYAAFSMQSMRLQAAFERNGAYSPKSYAQASAEVYLNKQHMLSEYLPGLLLSHYLWPHHYRQLRFFEYAFLEEMDAAHATHFVEVGVGTGLYSGLILRRLPRATGQGFDISPFAKSFAERHLSALGVGGRYSVELRDLTGEALAAPVDWLVCVEVLEHLEDPLRFLRALRHSLAMDGRAFITAAINSAHADHIYLYRNAAEICEQLQQAGFCVEQSFCAAAYSPTSKAAAVPEVAAFIVS